jgi:hypothetical protein
MAVDYKLVQPTKFVVTLRLPDGVSQEDMCRYIRESVQSWKGSYHPEDPLFSLNPKSVKVEKYFYDKKRKPVR